MTDNMDPGPWSAHRLSRGRWCVQSEDFKYDVTLVIHGDLGPDELERYANWLAEALNGNAKKFQEHLDAWKLSNEWHGARIAELEAELAALNAVKPECLR